MTLYLQKRKRGGTTNLDSLFVATRDAIVTSDPVLDGTSPLWGDVFA